MRHIAAIVDANTRLVRLLARTTARVQWLINGAFVAISTKLVVFHYRLRLAYHFEVLLHVVRHVMIVTKTTNYQIIFFRSHPFALNGFHTFNFRFFEYVGKIDGGNLMSVVTHFRFTLRRT